MTYIIRIISLIFLLFPSVSFADFVGIPKSEFINHYRAQKESMWCWASSAEMALSYQGVNLPQDEIVRHIKGIYINQTGSPGEMVTSTNGIFLDVDKHPAIVSGQYVIGAPLATVLYNQLKQKKPIILTYQSGPQSGHAVVLTGIDTRFDIQKGLSIDKMYVFDPFSYQVIPNGWGGVSYVQDQSLIYKEYVPQMTPNGLAISAGTVTGAILINGSHP